MLLFFSNNVGGRFTTHLPMRNFVLLLDSVNCKYEKKKRDIDINNSTDLKMRLLL